MPLDGFDDDYPFLPLGIGLAAYYLPALAPLAPADDPQTAALLKTVSAQIAAGTLDKSLFASALRELLTPAAINPARALLAPLGPLTSLTLMSRDPNGVALYQAVYGKTTVLWLIAVDKDHKITLLRPRRE